MNTRRSIKAHVPKVNTEVLSCPSDPALPLSSGIIELYFLMCHILFAILSSMTISTNKIRMQRITSYVIGHRNDDQLWTMRSLDDKS